MQYYNMDNLNRVKVCAGIFNAEYEWYFGANKDIDVKFQYYNKKKDTTTDILMPYRRALGLAFERARDGRYKNYDFLIDLA